MELILIPAPDASGKGISVPTKKRFPRPKQVRGASLPSGAHRRSQLLDALLFSGQFRLVVKTALKLLLVFVEYSESNAPLLIQAVSAVDTKRGK